MPDARRKRETGERTMSKFFAIGAVVITVAALGAMSGYVWFGRQDDAFAACRQAEAGGAAIGGPFSLVDKAGATVTDKEAITGPTLVYFGYTFCPDVCPLDMSRNAEVADMMAAEGRKLGLVFITVDPARDTPQVVGEFAANHHPDAIGLTGTVDQITAAAKAYKVYFKVNDDGTDYYPVDHTAFTYLMVPGTGLVDFYRVDTSVEDVAKSVSCAMDVAETSN
jgi:protein SCO1/2